MPNQFPYWVELWKVDGNGREVSLQQESWIKVQDVTYNGGRVNGGSNDATFSGVAESGGNQQNNLYYGSNLHSPAVAGNGLNGSNGGFLNQQP